MSETTHTEIASPAVKLDFEQRQRAEQLMHHCGDDDGDNFHALCFEVIALRDELRATLDFLKERMPCAAGKCCEDIRARITAIEAVSDEDVSK